MCIICCRRYVFIRIVAVFFVIFVGIVLFNYTLPNINSSIEYYEKQRGGFFSTFENLKSKIWGSRNTRKNQQNQRYHRNRQSDWKKRQQNTIEVKGLFWIFSSFSSLFLFFKRNFVYVLKSFAVFIIFVNFAFLVYLLIRLLSRRLYGEAFVKSKFGGFDEKFFKVVFFVFDYSPVSQFFGSSTHSSSLELLKEQNESFDKENRRIRKKYKEKRDWYQNELKTMGKILEDKEEEIRNMRKNVHEKILVQKKEEEEKEVKNEKNIMCINEKKSEENEDCSGGKVRFFRGTDIQEMRKVKKSSILEKWINENLEIVKKNQELCHSLNFEIQKHLILLEQKEEDCCPICFEEEKNIVLSPCGHLLCSNCSTICSNCPICRNEIIQRIRKYN